MAVVLYGDLPPEERELAHSHNGRQVESYILPHSQSVFTHYVHNLHGRLHLAQVEGWFLPLWLPEPGELNSYVGSLRTQYFRYAAQELGHQPGLNPLLKQFGPLAWRAVGALAEAMGSEKVVWVNAWLLSTSLWPDISPQGWRQLDDALRQAYPERAILYRGLTYGLNDASIQFLKELNAKQLASRQVYLLDPQDRKYRKKRPYQMDKKQWEKVQDQYEWTGVERIMPEEWAVFIDYYRELYLGKYSMYNPDYTPEWLQTAVEAGVLDMQVLRQDGRPVAMQAVARQASVCTTPCIGYDPELGAGAGLYRFLNLHLIHDSVERGLWLNMSSGAPTFKKQRGGVPALEVHMVQDNHLPGRRRLLWGWLELLSRYVVEPGFRRYGV